MVMKVQSLVVVTLSSTLFVASLVPVQAGPAAAADDPWVVWLDSEGASGTSRLSELTSDAEDASEQHCYGIAPLETTCTLTASGVTNYVVGWAAPSTEGLPVGVLFSSVDFEMTGSNGGRITGHCDAAGAGFAGAWYHFTLPPYPQWCWGWDQSLPPGGVRPAGDVTVSFTTDDYHPQGAGGESIPMAQLGTWHALLVTV